MQSIFIERLEADTVIGVYPEERLKPRPLLLDIELQVPDARGFFTDDLADTVDYDGVVNLVRRELATHAFQLVERLAQHLCEVLQRDTGASRVRLRIAKTGAVAGVHSVGVVLERSSTRAEASHPATGLRMMRNG